MFFNNNKFRTILQCDRGAKEIDLTPIQIFIKNVYSKLLDKKQNQLSFEVSFRIEPNAPYFYINSSKIDMSKELDSLDFLKIIKCNSDAGIVYACGNKEPSLDTIQHYEIYKNKPEISAIVSGISLPENFEITLIKTKFAQVGNDLTIMSSDLDSLYKDLMKIFNVDI